jgi:hypothetical protein
MLRDATADRNGAGELLSAVDRGMSLIVAAGAARRPAIAHDVTARREARPVDWAR